MGLDDIPSPPLALLLAFLAGMLAMFVMLFGDLVVGRLLLGWLQACR